MPQEKPAFFVEFFRNPLTEAYPEVFQPLGDGIELTRWRLVVIKITPFAPFVP